MYLEDIIKKTNQYKPIRIFADCQTIFHGSKADVSAHEWNTRVVPYYKCKVVHYSYTMNTTMVMI